MCFLRNTSVPRSPYLPLFNIKNRLQLRFVLFLPLPKQVFSFHNEKRKLYGTVVAFKNALTRLVDYCTLSSLQLQLSCIQRVDMTFRLFLIWVVRSHDIMAHQAAGHPQDHTLHVLCARGSFWWRMQLRRFLQWRQPRHSQ